GNLIVGNVNLSNRYNVNVAHIEFKKGRFKNPLSFELVRMLRQLNFENTTLLSGKVIVRLAGEFKDKEIDLLTNGFSKGEYQIENNITAFD
ncbi:hypothetical protein ACKI2C_49390, partial [Streptomyces brasiliscabiei]